LIAAEQELMNETPVIRNMGDSDIEPLSRLAIHTYVSTFGHTFTEADLAHHLQTHLAPNCFARILDEDVVLLAKAAGQLVGYVQFGAANSEAWPVSLNAGDQALRRLYVHPEFQNRGIGALLLEAALSHPRLKEAANIYLDVWIHNEGAQRLYKRYGFEVIGARAFEVASGAPTDPDLVMVRRSPR
jgi:ribosomal protein S18 acetylase RimI-like enzyme